MFFDRTETLSEEKQKEFQDSLDLVSGANLEEFLEKLESPCYESDLMKVAFPEFRILSASPLELYQRHFLLFNLLFTLQTKFYAQGKFLFVHFMRTFLLDFPESLKCRKYEPYLGKFCLGQTLDDKEYCDFHYSKIGENQLEELSERYFYFDPGNYFALDDESASAFMGGAWELLAQSGKIKQCFEVMGLPAGTSLKTLKAAFRELARQFHPDSGKGNEDRFKAINNAYHFLIRLWAGKPSAFSP